MIGDGWDGGPSIRPDAGERDEPRSPRRVAVVTGSRAEFGLLRPVMHAIDRHPELELLVIAAGSHLIPPAQTFYDVKRAFPIADTVPMQKPGRIGRDEDVQAVGAGIARFGRSFVALRPDWVVVLGDRIEAFAAAAAASIGGLALAHIHGGDRAEGIADESMRHAITKLAHLHLAATPGSAERIIRMGEPERFVHVVGSPAIDGLKRLEPADDSLWGELGEPEALVLLHPVGRHEEEEELVATAVFEALEGRRVAALAPNFDAGRGGIVRALEASAAHGRCVLRDHLPREQFVGVLKRLAETGGVLVGNSSAGLIEAAALRVRTVNIGRRQSGRERGGNAVDCPVQSRQAISTALADALDVVPPDEHPFGDGTAGERCSQIIAGTSSTESAMLRKRCAH